MCSIDANTISLAPPPKPTMKRLCCQSTLALNEPSLSISQHTRSSSTPAFLHNPELSASSASYPHSPRPCPRYISVSKSPPGTPIAALHRTGSPHCAPSRPNTPCSVFSRTDTTDSPEQLPLHSTPSANYVRGFSTAGSFAVVSEDTGGLLLLAALTLCIYILVT